MAYGFSCKNTSGDVIISDEFKNMHFLETLTADSNDGGAFDNSTGSNLSDVFPNFSGANAANALDGRVILTYTVTTTGVPLVFIKPNANAYDRWYSLIKQSNVGNDWEFEVLMSGIAVNNFPELFIFVDANEVPIGSDTYGMIVHRPDGTKTFDSRAQPLAVIDGGTSRPREYPCDEGRPRINEQFSNTGPFGYDDLDSDFHSNNQQNIGVCGDGVEGETEANCLLHGVSWTRYSDQLNEPFNIQSIQTDVAFTNIMFAAPAVSQAVYNRLAFGFTSGVGTSTAAWYVMYRTAFQIQDEDLGLLPGGGLQFRTGWGTYAAGYSFSSVEEDTGWFGGGGGSYSSGTQPYTAATINYTNNTFIAADASKYT